MEQTAKRRNFLAILAVYFAANAIFIMSPAMNAIATQLYPDKPYSNILLISTISSLCMIPGSLVAGTLLSRVGFRTMALISMGGIVVCGVLPAFISSLMAVYVLRGIVGFCIGIGFPLQSTLALQLFDDRERPKVLGMATVSLAAGSIIFMVFSGLLSDMDARYAFLFHAILLLPLAVVLVNLREPSQNAAASQETVSAAPVQGPMPVYAVFTALMFAVIFFAFYPVLLNMSSICANENIGGSVVAGMLLAVYTVGNMVGGFLFAPLSRAAGKLVVPIGLVIWIAGSGCIAFGRTVPHSLRHRGADGLARHGEHLFRVCAQKQAVHGCSAVLLWHEYWLLPDNLFYQCRCQLHRRQRSPPAGDLRVLHRSGLQPDLGRGGDPAEQEARLTHRFMIDREELL